MILNHTSKSIRAICLEEDLVSKAEPNHILDMRRMIEPGLPPKRKKR